MRFSHFGRGWQRATLALAPLAMVAILGCSAATSPAPTSEPGEPPPRAPSTPSPTPSLTPAPTSAPVGPTPTPVAINIRDVPMVNVDIHSVPLEDIVFDAFDGRFVRLSDALPEIHVGLRDAIRPIYNAGYGSEDALPWLTPDDLVIGYESATGAYAYPIKVLNVHEIVNDVIDGVPVLITYCPLCASGAVFSRELDGETLLFGNTSALYQSDLVMYDHGTGSYWFQVLGEAVVGDLTGKRLSLLPAATSPWGDWKALHPDTLLLTSFRPGSPPFSGPRYAGG